VAFVVKKAKTKSKKKTIIKKTSLLSLSNPAISLRPSEFSCNFQVKKKVRWVVLRKRCLTRHEEFVFLGFSNVENKENSVSLDSLVLSH
jgi:hypothetical protein